MLIAQLSYSEIDTLSYPRLAYPGEVVKDTCIEFTPLQAKLAMIDGINADSYKEQNDSLKSIVNDYQNFVNQKNTEIKQLNFDISVRNDLVDQYKTKSVLYEDWYKQSEKSKQRLQTMNKIGYPILGGVTLTSLLYMVVSIALHK
jgi:hypothetical protein